MKVKNHLFGMMAAVLLGSLLFATACTGPEVKDPSSEPGSQAESQTAETSSESNEEFTMEPIVLPEKTYTVGGDSEYQSLSALLLSLKDDKEPKVIYLNAGTYDIYREYRDLRMETPPDDIKSSDYLDRCVFLPMNTYLIGLGDVTLSWNPSPEEITLGEARTWSPLNVRYACYVENITIYCKYGRYCIHDDSHNDVDDRGVKHIYKDVRCVYDFSADKKGFNNTIGFGFSQKSEYIFENCEFVMQNCPPGDVNHSAFYGHAASGDSLDPEESPIIRIENCKIVGDRGNDRTVRFQSLNTCMLHAKAYIRNTKIVGGLYLTLYKEGAIQAFEVFLENSGDPLLKLDQSGSNPYPVKKN